MRLRFRVQPIAKFFGNEARPKKKLWHLTKKHGNKRFHNLIGYIRDVSTAKRRQILSRKWRRSYVQHKREKRSHRRTVARTTDRDSKTDFKISFIQDDDDDFNSDYRPRFTYSRPSTSSKKLPNTCSVCCNTFGRVMSTPMNVEKGISYMDILLGRKTRPGFDAQKNVTSTNRVRLPDVCGTCTVCTQCLRYYLSNKVTSISFVDGIKCPECNRRWQESEIRRMLPKDLLAKYELNLTRKALYSMPNAVFCVGPNCNNAMIIENSENCDWVCCSACRMDFCMHCKVPFHWGMRCSEFVKTRITGDANYKWTSEHTKPCPKCHTQIEKNEGCSHMHCSKCNLDWDWSRVEHGLYVRPEVLKMEEEKEKVVSQYHANESSKWNQKLVGEDEFDDEEEDFDDDGDLAYVLSMSKPRPHLFGEYLATATQEVHRPQINRVAIRV